MGAITGRVVDSRGRPVSDASVEVDPEPQKMGLIRNSGTNRKGAFIIRDLEVGRYKLYPSKEEAGYANALDHFYSAGLVKISEVTVISGHTVSCGDIHLGPKAGMLIGSFRDATTRKPVVFRSFTPITLRRLSEPSNHHNYGTDTEGNFKILVPPVPFIFELTTPGYEKKDLSVLHLKGGEIKRLDILLTRK